MKTLTTTNLRSFVYVFGWKFKHHLGSFYFISLLWRQTTWPTVYRCSLIAWMTLNSVMVCPYQRPVLNRSSCQMTEPLLCIIRSCVTYGTAEWNDEWMTFSHSIPEFQPEVALSERKPGQNAVPFSRAHRQRARITKVYPDEQEARKFGNVLVVL